MSLNTYTKILDNINANISKIDKELDKIKEELEEINRAEHIYLEIDVMSSVSPTGSFLHEETNSRLLKKYNLEMMRNNNTRAAENIQNLVHSLEAYSEKIEVLLLGILEIDAESEKRLYSKLAKNPHMILDSKIARVLLEKRLNNFQKKILVSQILKKYEMDPTVFDFFDLTV